MNEESLFNTLLELAKGAGVFGCVIMMVVAWIFYKRWLSADEYIKELNKLNNTGREDTLKEYVTSLTIIKERLTDIQAKLNNKT